MPIRAERRRLYPAEWLQISRRIRFGRACGRCEWIEEYTGVRCEAMHGKPHPVTGSVVILTTAHLNHDESCADEAWLRALCQLHHLRYDAKHHARNAAATLRARRAAGDLFT
jgi:hypothetical protein